jgi:hypothetical protein
MDRGAMRRLLTTVALVGMALALTTPAGQATSPKQDSVTGTARHLGADPPFPVIEVRFNARSEASGNEPKGHLVLNVPSFLPDYRGRVTCLNIVGNEATVGIEIVKSDDPSQVGRGELWSVVDGDGTGHADRVAGYAITATPPVECPPLSFNVPIVSGDYVVHDASA